MMNSELTDWNQLLGNSQPTIELSVERSAKRLSVEPRLLELREEQRGAEEQDADDVVALALLPASSSG